jgi:hypothetical protein
MDKDIDVEYKKLNTDENTLNWADRVKLYLAQAEDDFAEGRYEAIGKAFTSVEMFFIDNQRYFLVDKVDRKIYYYPTLRAMKIGELYLQRARNGYIKAALVVREQTLLIYHNIIQVLGLVGKTSDGKMTLPV